MLTHIIRWPVAVVIVALALPGCDKGVSKMSPEETSAVASLTQGMVTHCLGRFTVSLPKGFVPISAQSSAKIEQVEIEATPMTLDRFKLEFDAKHREYAAMVVKPENVPFLRAVLPLKSGESGGIFDRTAIKHGASGRSVREIELYFWHEGFTLRATTKGWDTSFPEFREGPYKMELEINTPEMLSKIHEIHARLRGRQDNEVPTEKGVCFLNGFLRGAPQEQEQIDVLFETESLRGVYVKFVSDADLREDDELLDRGKGIGVMLKAMSGYTIRKGKSKSPITSAQEWLMTRTAERASEPHQYFTLEANSRTGSAATPFLVFNMGSGGSHLAGSLAHPSAPALSEAQAVAVWDAIAATLKPRPGAF